MRYQLNERVAAYDKTTNKYFICQDSVDLKIKNYHGCGSADEHILYYFENFAGLRERSFDLAIKNIKLLMEGRKISVLDIGCSYGLFLKKVLEQGWDVFGIEPSENEARFAQERFGTKVSETVVEDFVPDNKWEVITFWDVFEHLPKPLDVLEKVKSMLNEGGILIIRVPNARGLIHRLSFIAYLASFGFFNFPLVKLFEKHQYIYTKHSLHEMLRKAGFEVILSYSEYMIEPHLNVIKRKSYITKLPRPLRGLASSLLVIILKLSGALSMRDSLVSYFRKMR